MTSEEWWNHLDKSTVQQSPVVRLRDEQWDYFENAVAPLLVRLVSRDLSGSVYGHLKQRLRIPNRFRPSQLLYAASKDYPLNPEFVIWASAALELNLLARLIQDDIADVHTSRWGLPALRVLYGDTKAAQVVAVLNHLTVFCGAKIDRALGDPMGICTPALIAEFSRLTSAAMIDELEWSQSGDQVITYDRYQALALRKVSSGQLTVRLLETALGKAAKLDGLFDAIRLLDLAACITNDVTEANLRRGLEEVRFVEGERRGERSEIQLGRPTIFSAILASDSFLLENSAASIAVMPDFGSMSTKEIFFFLRDTGAIRDAEARIEALEEQAMAKIVPGTSIYVLLHKSLAPNISPAPPRLSI